MTEELFKLIEKKFSKVDNEWQWTYLVQLIFIFNRQKIKKITITDHIWKKSDRELITKEQILKILFENLNGGRKESSQKYGNREVFVEEKIPYQNRNYLLVFWFENNNSDWLWVRNCYPIS